MANVTTVLTSTKFPVGTVVGAYRPAQNRHHEGKPSGTAEATATVASTGKLTFTNLPEGMYALWAEVEGKNANLQLGNIAYVEPPPNLLERIKARRVELGVE